VSTIKCQEPIAILQEAEVSAIRQIKIALLQEEATETLIKSTESITCMQMRSLLKNSIVKLRELSKDCKTKILKLGRIGMANLLMYLTITRSLFLLTTDKHLRNS